MLDPATGLPYVKPRQPAPGEPAATPLAGLAVPPQYPPPDYALVVETERRAGVGLQLLAVIVALLGGALGIVGAVVNELSSAVLLIGAGVIEEAMKPTGVFIILWFWPYALRGRVHTAVLAALGALAFALVEALVYIQVYYPEGGDDFVRFRLTVPIAMHVIASFIVGLGLNRGIFDWAAGRAPFPRRTRNFYIAGVAIHEIYNITAVILTLAGVLTFEGVD